MGSANSPAASGRFGAASLRLICHEVEEMQRADRIKRLESGD
jgi:hypothetical protein